MTKPIIKDRSGERVEIRGWAQYGGKNPLTSIEITSLEINIGSNQLKIRLDMSGDDLLAWCRAHNLDYTDAREWQRQETT